MRSSIEVSGLRELGAAFKELDSRVQKRIARSATAAGGRVIANEAKAIVPVDKGTIKRNIRVANLRPSQPGVQESAVGVRVKGKTGESAFHWVYVEFGTAKMAPQPFLRPAYESKKVEAANKIKEQLSKRLDAEAAKIGQTIGKTNK